MKKIIISIMIVLTIFSSVSFANSNTLNLYKNENSVEGKFLRKIFKDIKRTPTTHCGNGLYTYKTDLVSAMEAIRLCLSSSVGTDHITNKEAMELAKYLVDEMKNKKKSKKWYQNIFGRNNNGNS